MNKFGKISVITSSTMLPISLLFSRIVEWQLKSANTDNVDITSGLAYLRPIIIVGFSLFAVFFITSIVSAVMGFRKDHDKTYSKLGIFISVVVLVLSIGLILVNGATDQAIKTYRTTQQ